MLTILVNLFLKIIFLAISYRNCGQNISLLLLIRPMGPVYRGKMGAVLLLRNRLVFLAIMVIRVLTFVWERLTEIKKNTKFLLKVLKRCVI